MAKRIPQIEDLVFLRGKHGGPFAIVAVYAKTTTVDIRPVKGKIEMAFTDKGIPWVELMFADEEDASQAAARTVREATEDH